MKMNCTKYNIIAIIGKSASGKDSIAKEIAKLCSEEVALIRQTTTRPRRENEDENAYHFVSFQEFQSNKNIIAQTKFKEWLYGTNLEDLAIDKWNIGVFTPWSVRLLLNDDNEKINNLIIFYIQADDRVRLERSLAREPQGDIIEMCRRMLADDKDFKEITFDYYPILNNQKDDFKKAIDYIWTKIMHETFKKNNFTTYEALEYLVNEWSATDDLFGQSK